MIYMSTEVSGISKCEGTTRLQQFKKKFIMKLASDTV